MRKHPGVLLLFLLVLGTVACHKSKDEPTPPPVDTGSSTHIMFWTSSYFNLVIHVTCNDQTKDVTIYHYGAAPGCGSSGSATFDLEPGAYPVMAINGPVTYIDTITVAAGECKKVDLDSLPIFDTSNASLIAGNFSGTTHFLPGGIDLGTSADCDSVNYTANFLLGNATAVVTEASDTTVDMHFSSIYYPTIDFLNVPLTRTAEQLHFPGGYYSLDSKHLYFIGLTPNSIYQTTNACLVQFPFVYGWDPDGTGFDYKTIENLEFFGVKSL